MIASPAEFHISIRVSDLDESTAFYTQFSAVSGHARSRLPVFFTVASWRTYEMAK